jgi:hypothetical protein
MERNFTYRITDSKGNTIPFLNDNSDYVNESESYDEIEEALNEMQALNPKTATFKIHSFIGISHAPQYCFGCRR